MRRPNDYFESARTVLGFAADCQMAPRSPELILAEAQVRALLAIVEQLDDLENVLLDIAANIDEQGRRK